jgi:endonuclease YncB( thermonuclease family)
MFRLRQRLSFLNCLFFVMFVISACTLEDEQDTPADSADGDLYTVVNVIDGDTIDVQQGEITYRVRYVGVNTPERDELCYFEAAEGNRNLVSGQIVRMVQDQSNTDRYGRLLRYVYVGNVFVNEQLVRDGYAEAVLYEPDDLFFDAFSVIELEAAQANLGCHGTGIFNDGSVTR